MNLRNRLVLAALVLTLVAGPAMAEGGNIARVIYWKIKAGTEAQFEAGIQAHNALHAANNDPVAIFTGVILSGHHQGEYLRSSLGHAWADFDGEEGAGAEEDADDMAVHVYPYVESERTVFYEYHPELSRPMGGPAPLGKAIFFHLKPGQDRAFSAQLEKIHAALEEQEEWGAYDWYSVADGGKQPTWVVVLPRENWAGFEPSGSLGDVVAAKYGDEAPGIWEALFSTVAGQYSHTMAFPAELAYTPAGE